MTVTPGPYAVIGIDPGVTTGFCVLRVRVIEAGMPSVMYGVEAFQCSHDEAVPALRERLLGAQDRHRVAIERFVVRHRAGHSRTPGAGEITRRLWAELLLVADERDVPRVSRAAYQVKPWATDDRLAVASLFEPTKARPHARDAARHALFEAVHAGVLVDPMEVVL